MSSSKSQKRSGSQMEESVDIRSDACEEADNVPIQIEEDDTHTTQEAPSVSQTQSMGKGKGKEVANEYGRRAECWKYFTEIKENGKRVAGKCKFCDIVYKADSSKNGTKNLKNHFPKCPKNPDNQSKLKQAQLVFEKDPHHEGEATLKSWVLNVHEARQSIAKMIIMDELPFRFVENVGFRLMMSVCCPSLNMPSRTTIARDIYHLYVDERLKLKEHLAHSCQRVSVTTDTWTSLQRINYMVITAHFVDNDWKLHKKILNFCAISSHKGDDIALVLGKCLQD